MNDEILSQLDQVTEQFMIQKDTKGQVLLEKYTQTFIYALVQKHIFDLEALFTETPKQTIDIFDFVYHMLKFTNQPNEETMYVVIQLIDFFKLVCDESQEASSIRFHDISNYICKYNPKIESESASDGRLIMTHHLPPQQWFKTEKDFQTRKVRDIDINPPVVLGGISSDIQRINKERMYIDSSKNSNSAIIRVMYSAMLHYVFALHQYSDHVQLYNVDCTVDLILKPRSPQLRNTIILDICWSERQQRLGATFKDQWLCFWDAADLKYEKVFSAAIGDQNQIYYLSQVNKWLTIDGENRIHFWNLEIEELQYTINSSVFDGGSIIEIVEVDHLQLTCLAGLTFLTLWDMTVPKMLFKVNVDHTRLHGVVFFRTYQLILTCGYDNRINLYSLHKRYNDGDWMGKLEGHTSLVTAIQAIEGTPMVVTSDDKHIIKVWDIRILKCVQTFDLELRQPIGKIIMFDIQAICLVTSRLIVIEMENCTVSMPSYKNARNQKKLPEEVPAQPLRFELDSVKRQILVATKRDIRFVDMMLGRTTKIIKGVLDSNDDEITSFRTLQQHKKFIVGTQKGNVRIFDCETGDLISEFYAHNNEISALIIDYQNKILTTASFDSQILIWKEMQATATGSLQQRDFKFEKMREVKNVHHSGNIIITELSVYHNLLVTCSNSPQLLIWNFEYGRLAATLNLEDDNEPTAVTFINGYCLLVVATNRGAILIFHFSVKQETVKLTLRKRIDTAPIPSLKFISTQNEDEQTSTPIQYNTPQKLPTIVKLGETRKRGSQTLISTRALMSFKPASKQEDVDHYTKIVADVRKEGETVVAAELVASTQSGYLHLYVITELFKSLEFIPHCNTRVNYNPYRQSKEDFNLVVNTHKLDHWKISGSELTRVGHEHRHFHKYPRNNMTKPDIETKAHREGLTCLSYVSFEGENLLVDVQRLLKICTCSSDQFIKIWTHDLQPLCSLNINHPLPIRWEVTVNEQEILKFKLAFALKVVHFIRKNCSSSMSVAQARMLEPSNMFKQILSVLQPHNTKFFITIPKEQPKTQQQSYTARDEQPRVQLMKEEFSQRDVLYEKVKHLYRSELQGPTLRQLEDVKKVYTYAQMWKKQQQDQQRQLEQLNKKNQQINDEKQKELKQILQFLHPKFRTRIMQDEFEMMENKTGIVAQLESKFEKGNTDGTPTKIEQTSMKKIEPSNGTDSLTEGKRRSNFVSNSVNFKSFPGASESDQDSLPKISMVKTHRSKMKSTQNFFEYAGEKQLDQESTGKFSMRSTQNSLFGKKVKIISDNKGLLVSDFQGELKQQVVKNIGVNLMRKTSSNLFNQIVNKLDQKLKHSKFAVPNQIASQDTTHVRSPSVEQTESKLSTSVGPRPVELRQIQFDEKLEGLISTVREKVAKKLASKQQN